MVVTLYTQEIIRDLRMKSHYEVSAIESAEARYRIEAGTEKTEEIERCVHEGIARLTHRLSRWLRPEMSSATDNTVTLPDAWSFDLVLSERRAIGKEAPAAEIAQTFVVEYALSKFYSDMNAQDYSNKHSVLALDAASRLDDLLYTKMPPRV